MHRRGYFERHCTYEQNTERSKVIDQKINENCPEQYMEKIDSLQLRYEILKIITVV